MHYNSMVMFKSLFCILIFFFTIIHTQSHDIQTVITMMRIRRAKVSGEDTTIKLNKINTKAITCYIHLFDLKKKKKLIN